MSLGGGPVHGQSRASLRPGSCRSPGQAWPGTLKPMGLGLFVVCYDLWGVGGCHFLTSHCKPGDPFPRLGEPGGRCAWRRRKGEHGRGEDGEVLGGAGDLQGLTVLLGRPLLEGVGTLVKGGRGVSQLNPRASGRHWTRCPPFASPRPQPLAASEMLVTHKVP